MLFQIMYSDNGEAATNQTFASADEAQAARPILEIEKGRKLRIAKITGDAWRKREEMLFANGTRKPLPSWWLEASWWVNNADIHRDHYAHMSVKRDGMMAFTETPQKGEADIQTPITPSRYLARFFSEHLRPEEIAAIDARFKGGDTQLHISDKPEDFQAVYRAAPSVCAEDSTARSCMNGAFSHLPHHPAYVYGAGDLAIAYTVAAGTLGDAGFLVNSRAVIWPKMKTFVRLYGDSKTECATLRALLNEEGYEEADHFEGARLLKIKTRGSYLMPYLDSGPDHPEWRGCDDHGDHFYISCDGEIDATNTNGLADIGERYTCDHCGDDCVGGERQFVNGGGNWCPHCVDNDAFFCEYEEEYYNQHQYMCHEVIVTRRGTTQIWGERAVNRHAFMCDNSGDYYDSNTFTAIEVTTANGVETWCEEYTNGEWFDDGNGNAFSCADFTPIEVIQADGSTETFCKEKPIEAFFLCEACGKHYVMSLLAPDGRCLDCVEANNPSHATIHDETQITFYLKSA